MVKSVLPPSDLEKLKPVALDCTLEAIGLGGGGTSPRDFQMP